MSLQVEIGAILQLLLSANKGKSEGKTSLTATYLAVGTR